MWASGEQIPIGWLLATSELGLTAKTQRAPTDAKGIFIRRPASASRELTRVPCRGAQRGREHEFETRGISRKVLHCTSEVQRNFSPGGVPIERALACHEGRAGSFFRRLAGSSRTQELLFGRTKKSNPFASVGALCVFAVVRKDLSGWRSLPGGRCTFSRWEGPTFQGRVAPRPAWGRGPGDP
jgi:hypothetical protein